MRRIILLSFLGLLSTQIYSQFTTDEITYVDRIDLENSNSWAVGGGISNFIMHGDLRSMGTNNLGNFYNFGGYAYLDKMFNPLLGLEGKLFYTQMSGGAQYLSDIYEILYLPDNDFNRSGNQITRNGVTETINKENLFFEGRAYGLELNLIFSFSNLYQTSGSKWNAAGYFGVGYHQYNSALYEKLDDGSDFLFEDANFGSNPTRNSQKEASSIYLSAQFGLKRKLSKKVDLELRTGMYFNYEDHLDATISNKQDWETFFVSSIGVVVKLGKKKVFTIWGDDDSSKRDKFKIIDSDGDGVMDQLDMEPNTPKGVMVYGNGRAVDTDKDGIPDYKDQCPLRYGPVETNGCPIGKDSDGDGIMDENDLCPTEFGTLENKGCPDNVKENIETPDNINQSIALLATSIYFDTNSDKIQVISYATLDKIAALMKKIPESKFLIEGHTDNTNSDKYNLYLSQRRSASVKKYLINTGISNTRLEAKGYGESRPKYSNDTHGGRQLNRRVEINPVNSFD